MEILQKLKVDVLYNPGNPLWGTYPEELKSLFQRDICTLMFIATLFYSSQGVETT